MRVLNFDGKIINNGGVIPTSITRTTLLWGLVDYWKLDSNADSSTGSGNNGSVTGATNGIAKINNGYSFTGTNNISIGTTSTYNFMHQTAIFSIALWVKMTSHNSDAARAFLSNNSGASAQAGVCLLFENRSSQSSPRAIRLFVTKAVFGQSVYSYQSANNVITDDNWHHVVITSVAIGGVYTVQLYVDGVKQTGSVNIPFPVAVVNASNPMLMGIVNGFTSPLLGSLDEVAIWNRPLLHEEVIKLYNGGSGLQYPF